MSNTFADIFRDEVLSQPSVLTTSSSTPQNLTLTYGDLKAQISSFISQALSLLNSSHFPGLPIASMLPNGIECLVAFLGTALMRSIPAPLNPAMKQSEVEFYLEDSSSKILLVPANTSFDSHEGVLAAKKLGVQIWTITWKSDTGISLSPLDPNATVSSAPEPDFASVLPSDVALLLHTSGTTGRPKDRTFVVMPMFHVHGLIGSIMSTLISGGSVVLPPRYSASAFWDEYIESKSTWYSAVPTIHQIQLQTKIPENLPKIRFIRSCSASLAPSVLEKLEKNFNAPVLEAYAMTEASHQMCSNPIPPAQHKAGSVGKPQGIELAILDDAGHRVHLGEVCIRGDNVTSGYLNNPSANASSFTKIFDSSTSNAEQDDPSSPNAGKLWFRTGDQGYLDSDGYLFLTGRIKELINRGGEKISPLEIDAVLLNCPGVSEAISFGVDDPLYGQEVYAAVIPNEDSKSLTESDVKEFVAKHLAKFKVPKVVYISDFLPKTATGKIQRKVVAEYFTGKKSQ
ncbi:hypothetical protein BB560_000185 [Smittium megazygosporum]|uniref:AMP-dependent synthetase/ligase domain-containing protein n=1 Tax=Smittium megazygosporum TaxID=133381 RepID=A0A2T9ZL30_9FUNG|nr:hypothetical protein BB560_000185 [Smittium megazygosporum]